jgi:DNA uptake protein ComE-like DNA-binding protein
MILIISSEPAWRWYKSSQQPDFSQERKTLDSLSAAWDSEKKITNKSIVKEHAVFSFDPNKISKEELEELGFSKQLSNRIAGYRLKGGVFRVKRDLMKIYGMDSTLYHQLYAYIELPEAVQPEKNERKKFEKNTDKRADKTLVTFDINKADTTQLKSVYGIGKVLAIRITTFRNNLGGFIDEAQLSEVYGLDSTVVKKLDEVSYVEENFEPKKININTADEKTLGAHPYIKKTIAKAIMAYRFQHGNFADVRDLFKIAIIPPQQAEKLVPYLKVKD